MTVSPLLYPFHDFSMMAFQPMRAFTKAGIAFWDSQPWRETPFARQAKAALTMVERATRDFKKPAFGIQGVEERVVWQTPFCRLIHFEKPAVHMHQPKLLLVAPMSGHYATLLRDTIATMLPEFDCYVTDWENARDIPVSAGHFDLDDYTDHVIDILHFMGERAHVMAVCQPSVPVLVAASLMAARKDKLAPLSMVLMGGPIDTTKSPTAVNKFAENKSLAWFENSVVMNVPATKAGAGRKVYPGFMQLFGFLSMNPERHMKAHRELYDSIASGDGKDANRHTIFYDEYMAVMDLTAEFYLQTMERVFMHQDLPHGTYKYRGEKVDPGLITDTALMTVEAERDDISGIGQTEGAQALCTAVPAEKKLHHLQMGVGHYGVFSGSKFRAEVAPLIADFLLAQKA